MDRYLGHDIPGHDQRTLAGSFPRARRVHGSPKESGGRGPAA